MSHQTKIVLQILLDMPHQYTHGYELTKATGINSGTLYTILNRLETTGILASEWEKINALGRPPRRYYQLTPTGRSTAERENGNERDALRQLAPGWGGST